MSADNTANWVNRDLLEAIKKGDVLAIADAGHMKYEDAEYIISYYETYEMYHGNDPVEDEDMKYFRLVRKASSREFNRAIGNGNISRMAYAVGHTRDSNTADIADWNKYEVLKDLFKEKPTVSDLTNQVFQCMIISNQIPPTGRGKSSTMYTMSEIALSVHPDIDIRSNNPNDAYEDIEPKWSDLKKWIKSDGKKLLLLDEAKQFLMFSDQKAGKKLSKMLALLRHHDGHVIFVAHTGAGIPKDMRRQLFILNKLSQTEAELGYGIKQMKNDDRYEVSNTILKLNNVPHTNIEYKSKGEQAIRIDFDEDESDSIESNPTPERSEIDFPDDITSKTEKINYMYSVMGMNQENIADYLGVKQGGISYHLNK